MCDDYVQDPYFCVPVETELAFAQKNTPLDQPGFKPMTFWSIDRNPNHWTTESDGKYVLTLVIQ